MGEGLACRHVAPRPFAEQDLHPLRHRGITGASGCIAQQLQAIVVVLLDEAAAALAVLEGMTVSWQHGGEALEVRPGRVSQRRSRADHRPRSSRRCGG